MRKSTKLRAINGGDDDGPTAPNLFDRATITVLDDGRVEARIEKVGDESDEIILRTSQKKAASFIFNDLAPALTTDANRVAPFGGNS